MQQGRRTDAGVSLLVLLVAASTVSSFFSAVIFSASAPASALTSPPADESLSSALETWPPICSNACVSCMQPVKALREDSDAQAAGKRRLIAADVRAGDGGMQACRV